jgi:hypothetical protein
MTDNIQTKNMNISMEKIIRKAIEGGWKLPNIEDESEVEIGIRYYIKNPHKIFMDPLFWQALGKTCGWGKEMVLIDEPGRPKEWCFYYHCSVCGEIIVDEEDGCENMCSTDNPPEESWLYNAKQFHEINLMGSFNKAVDWLENEIK